MRQAWPTPSAPRPIVVVGAGAIVRTAHLPAYTRLRFPIAGVFDVCRDAAEQTARQFGGLRVLPSIDDVGGDVVVALAVPGKEIAGIPNRPRPGAGGHVQTPAGGQ